METSHGREYQVLSLDAHKDSIAVAVCEAGREPSRFEGTLGPDVKGVLKTLLKYCRQGKSAWSTRLGRRAMGCIAR